MKRRAGITELSIQPSGLPHEHRQLKALTGIRALAALWVVVYHFENQILDLFPGVAFLSPLFDSGYLGVDLFFGLSGFILAYNYLHRLGQGGTWRDRFRFLWLRLARVWPVQFFTLNIAVVMVLIARSSGLTIHSEASIRYTPLAYVENLFLTHAWFGEGLSFNGPGWSVSAEWFAYLLFPLLALGVIRVRSLWGAWLGAAACYAVLVTAYYAMYWGQAGGTTGAALRVGLEFLAGCFLFRVWESTGNAARWKWLVPASTVGIVLGSVAVGATYPHGIVLAPLFGLLILGLAKDNGPFARALSTPRMFFGGETSYSLYMTHGLVIAVLAKLLPAERFTDSGWFLRACVLCADVVVFAVAAVLTYLWVEKPARRRMRAVRVFATPRPAKGASLAKQPEL